MTSSPPTARDSAPPALPQFAEAQFRAQALDESVIFFCVEDAPRQSCRTESLPNGQLTFRTKLEGTLEGVEREHFVVGGVRVRHLMPSAIDLSELVGHTIQVDISQAYVGAGRATIDAEIRDAKGRLLLWARDGRMPSDRAAHGLALRATVAPGGAHRLAAAHAGGVASVSVPDHCRVRTTAGAYDLIVLRAGADDVAFVLLRR